jgi:hypothetical protein
MEQRAAVTAGLGQLTTSVSAAQSMTDWFLARFRNDAAPLTSVELLLSPAVYMPDKHRAAGVRFPADAAPAWQRLGLEGPTALPVEAATLKNVLSAFDRWYTRCNSDSGNVAIFYFSGHGLQIQDQLLLLEDFGSDPYRPLDNAINFDKTYMMLGKCIAETQCYFLDACRELPEELLEDYVRGGQVGTGLLGAGTPGKPRPRCAPTYRAAAWNRQASGPMGRPTHFARILQTCLEGLAVAPNRVRKLWVVDTETLNRALMKAIEFERVTIPDLSVTRGHDEVNSVRNLHYVADGPLPVLTVVDADPPPALGEVDVYAEDAEGKRILRPQRQSEPWRLKLEKGAYVFGADSSDGAAFSSLVTEPMVVLPPWQSVTLEWPAEPLPADVPAGGSEGEAPTERAPL